MTLNGLASHPTSLVQGKQPLRRRLLLIISVAYLALVCGLWLVLQWADAWWPATLLMFAPRWIVTLPLAILIPVSLFMRYRLAALILLIALIVCLPVIGFNIPWQRLTNNHSTGTPFKVMTLNMHYSDVDSQRLEEFIRVEAPAIIAIQEWPGFKSSEIFKDPSWHLHASERLFLASRYPIKKMIELGGDSMGENASVGHYELETPVGLLNVLSLHTATTRQGISDTMHERSKGPLEITENSARRLEQSHFIATKAEQCTGHVLLMGDFNTPPESVIFPRVWQKYSDTFTVAGWGLGYSFRGAHTAVRIDHILTGKGWTCSDCRVGPFVGSLHRPVVADLRCLGDGK